MHRLIDLAETAARRIERALLAAAQADPDRAAGPAVAVKIVIECQVKGRWVRARDVTEADTVSAVRFSAGGQLRGRALKTSDEIDAEAEAWSGV